MPKPERNLKMPLLYRQARSRSPTFLDSPGGLALWSQMEVNALKENVSADNFSFPVLVVQSAANGFMSAGVVREASGELAMSADAVEYCEPITETLAPPGLFFPVRTLYVELATLRNTQHVFT